jgi:ubiquitin-like 1-activating enzyme E1 B
MGLIEGEISLKRLATRILEMKKDQSEDEAPPIISFDKDDEDTLDFVAASANLRSLVFGIDVKTKFDIKRKISPSLQGDKSSRNY